MAEYIAREALMKNFCGCDLTKCVKYGNKDAGQQQYSYSTMMMYEIADEIMDAPSADVAQVVHGRWEKWNGDDRHHCTVCECYANAERDSYGYIAYEFLDNYCPNCGAMMNLEEKNGKSKNDRLF